LAIKSLDPYYFSVTFVRSGNYRVGTSLVQVAGRVVSPLR
jgi:hypothetical protein